MVGDVRFLPNPQWIPETAHSTANTRTGGGGTGYVLSVTVRGEYLDTFRRLLELTTAGYRGGKSAT